MGKPLEDLQTLMEDNQIAKVIKTSGHEDIVFEEDNGEYKKGDTFLSFHR